MGERTLNERIMALLTMAIRPLSASDIRRRLEGDVQPDEISSRLSKMHKQGKVISTTIPSQSITGPRIIKGWVSIGNSIAMEHVPDIAKESLKAEIAFREVAS